MVAWLQRFYGGRVTDWLRMDKATLDAFSKAAIKIHAQERLATIYDRAVASGAMSKIDAQRHIESLERQMGRKRPKKPSLAELSAMGIIFDG